MRSLPAIPLGLACLLALAPSARAEWTVWGRSDGLIDDRVTSLYEDRDGTLWVGTTVGISHYDGATWRSFGPADGLPARDAEEFLRDRSGVLWVDTQDGLYWSADGSRFTPADGVLVTSRRIFEDREGNLWFATAGGVYRLDGVTLTRFTRADGLANDEVRGIYQDRSGAMWFATDGGVSRYDGATWRTYTPADGLADGDVTSMLEDRHGAMWFGSDGHGATRHYGSAWRIFTTTDGLPSDYVTGMFEDRSGELWMWSSLGAASFDGSRWHPLELQFGSPGNLEAALEDRSGALWFAQYNVGVARYDRSSWRTFTATNGLGVPYAYRIDEDRSGAMWFLGSFGGGGATRFDGEAWRTFTTADGLAGDQVFRAYQDRAGWIWFPTDQGMSRFDGATWQTFTQAGGTNLYGRFDKIAEDRDGGIWFGGDAGVVVRYDGSTWMDFPTLGYVNAIAVDSAGAVWVASSSGAERYDGSTWVAYPELGVGLNGAMSLVVDHSGVVWKLEVVRPGGRRSRRLGPPAARGRPGSGVGRHRWGRRVALRRGLVEDLLVGGWLPRRDRQGGVRGFRRNRVVRDRHRGQSLRRDGVGVLRCGRRAPRPRGLLRPPGPIGHLVGEHVRRRDPA
jgi:ligand-binding sensor domain-containing protein